MTSDYQAKVRDLHLSFCSSSWIHLKLGLFSNNSINGEQKRNHVMLLVVVFVLEDKKTHLWAYEYASCWHGWDELFIHVLASKLEVRESAKMRGSWILGLCLFLSAEPSPCPQTSFHQCHRRSPGAPKLFQIFVCARESSSRVSSFPVLKIDTPPKKKERKSRLTQEVAIFDGPGYFSSLSSPLWQYLREFQTVLL